MDVSLSFSCRQEIFNFYCFACYAYLPLIKSDML